MDETIVQCGVEICIILQKHYSDLLKNAQEQIKKTENEIHETVYSTENEEYKQHLIKRTHNFAERLQRACTKQAGELNEKLLKKVSKG